MRESIRLGRVAGVAVGLHWSVLVIFLLVAQGLAVQVLPQTVEGESTAAYWVTALGVAVLFFGSLLAHELAHALVARRFGIEVERITLWMLGGVAQLAGEPPTARADLLVAGVGPAVSLLAAGTSAALAWGTDLLGGPALLVAGLAWLAGINILLAAFNLLPGAPLDGGRILRALLWRRSGDHDRAVLGASRAGRVLGMLLVVAGALELVATNQFFGGMWLMLIGWFLAAAATAEGEASRRGTLVGGLRVVDLLRGPVEPLTTYATVERALERAVEERVDLYPVVDFEGRFAGVVTGADLARVPPGRREEHRVAELTVALTPQQHATPDEPASAVLTRTGGAAPIAVLDGERLVGLVTPADLEWALRRASLGDHTPATTGS